MTTRQIAPPVPRFLEEAWGLGCSLADHAGNEVIGHSGSTIGQRAYLRTFPKSDAGICLLTNGGRSADLFRALLAELGSDLTGSPLLDGLDENSVVVDPDLGRFVGDYRLIDAEFVVAIAPGGLEVTSTPSPLLADLFAPDRVQLRPVGGGRFITRSGRDRSWGTAGFISLDGRDYLVLGLQAAPRTLSLSENGYKEIA
jgi:hypothetical protein